jgi:hypothetical protein
MQRCAIQKRNKDGRGSIMEVELPKDFKDFLRLLNDEKADYLLIGGYDAI